MNKPRSWNPEQLPQAVKGSTSVDGVLRSLSIPLAGGNRETVKRWIQKMSIDTSHFLGQGHRKGSTEPVVEGILLKDILVENSTYTNSHRLKLRLISEGIKLHECEVCFQVQWMNKPIPLELHHKNGERYDHRIENLQLVCPNCHAQTDTYRAKNID